MSPTKTMKKIKILIMQTLIVTLVFVGAADLSFAQDTGTDVNALVQETQKMSKSADEMTIVWWIPEEFWQISFSQSPNMTPEQAEEFVTVLRPYMIIVAIDGTIGSYGGVTYKPEQTVRESIRLIDKRGTSYPPLNDDQIDAGAKDLLATMKPDFENMLGPMGKNMHFILFPSKNKRGREIVTATKEGHFSVNFGGREFKWRLPLGSLLPLKTCPIDGEKLNGAWKFCPWHGKKLK